MRLFTSNENNNVRTNNNFHRHNNLLSVDATISGKRPHIIREDVRTIRAYVKTGLYWFIELLKLKYMLCVVFLMIFRGYMKDDRIT